MIFYKNVSKAAPPKPFWPRSALRGTGLERNLNLLEKHFGPVIYGRVKVRQTNKVPLGTKENCLPSLTGLGKYGWQSPSPELLLGPRFWIVQMAAFCRTAATVRNGALQCQAFPIGVAIDKQETTMRLKWRKERLKMLTVL